MDHELFNNPFASNISLLEAEADIFSGDQLQSTTMWPDLDNDNIQDLAPPVANNATSSGGSGSHRKLSHNAYERDRRKELNELYSSLRSLLPNEDHTKKMSIPITVCRVLKYIPELQREVENLERKKNELTKAHCKPGIVNMTAGSTTPVVSATCLNDMEVIVQVSLLCSVAATTLPLSKCIEVLEKEGLHLITSSAYSTFENRTFYTLHLQRSQGMDKEPSAFCDELERVVRKKAEGS